MSPALAPFSCSFPARASPDDPLASLSQLLHPRKPSEKENRGNKRPKNSPPLSETKRVKLYAYESALRLEQLRIVKLLPQERLIMFYDWKRPVARGRRYSYPVQVMIIDQVTGDVEVRCPPKPQVTWRKHGESTLQSPTRITVS